MRGALGFWVLWFWLFFKLVFRFFATGVWFFSFDVHCGLQVFGFLAFGFQFS